MMIGFSKFFKQRYCRIRLIACLVLVACLAAGCTGKPPAENVEPTVKPTVEPTGGQAMEPTAQPTVEPTVEPNQPDDPEQNEIIDFTMYSGWPGTEKASRNEIKEIIAQKTGVRVEERWYNVLQQLTFTEGVLLLSQDDMPDYLYSDEIKPLYEAGILVPWDAYLEKYPNLKAMYTDAEWDGFRQEDGHIYSANVFYPVSGRDRTTIHNGAAFWIQVRVLEWAGYPEIKTLNDYFDLLERYYAVHQSFTDEAGGEVDIIPYTVSCDDWRISYLEGVPQFLDGYPDEGCCIVNTADFDRPTAVDYNNSPTAVRYFEKLNKAYNKGLINKDFAGQYNEDYLRLISTGAVLGMFDAYWNFAYYVNPEFEKAGLDRLGCNYVPLGLTIDEGVDRHYHVYQEKINTSFGISVTTSCFDPDRAFKFLNDLLEPEILKLRFWGVEGEDYLADGNGLFYRTEEMRERCADEKYIETHMCEYSYMPQLKGTCPDGINAIQPAEQVSEFYANQPEPVADCLRAYGAENYVEMLGPVNEEAAEGLSMRYSVSDPALETPGMKAYTEIDRIKREWLPKVVATADFEKAWDEYMEAYEACNPQIIIEEMQEKLDSRL